MKNKKMYNQSLHIFLVLISIIILALLIINIIFINKSMNIEGEFKEQVYYTKAEGTYDNNKKYYTNLDYKNLKKLYKSQNTSTIAVIDNSSKIYNKFIELTNKIAFYNNTKIYLLETSKLSNKNEIAFYNLDERLKKLDTNYIITVCNNKIISITTFEESEINRIIKGLGE